MFNEKKWRFLVVIIILTGLGFGGFAVYQRVFGQNSIASEITEQETFEITRQTLQITVEGSGSLAPKEKMSVPFAAGGKVIEGMVDVGGVR